MFDLFAPSHASCKALVPTFLILTGAIICAFGWFMPAHTEQGARALEGVLGFEDFLVHVESDRFNRMIKPPR